LEIAAAARKAVIRKMRNLVRNDAFRVFIASSQIRLLKVI
jgi:hypothetical protein